MKIVLEEYLKTLREKDELDTLLCDLLLLDGYTVFNRPKTGERQYGVDILAKKGNKTFLFVVKQKDIDRAAWDSNQNSVRQSLNDIIDVYLTTMLTSDYKTKCIHIVIVTNGYLQAAVQPNFKGYQEQHHSFNDIPLYFDVWNIDTLVLLCDRVAFTESLFESGIQSKLRKALYFLDEDDYSNKYYEDIIGYYIELLKSNKSTKKVFTSFYTCVTMLSSWAIQSKRYIRAIDITECCLLKLWKLFLDNQFFEKQKYIYWFNRFVMLYVQNNNLLLKETAEICDIKNGLMYTNKIENRLLIYELIGRLSTYGLFCFYTNRIDEANRIADILITLLNNNQQYKYPVYDNNIIELSLLFLLVKSCKSQELKTLIECIIIGIFNEPYSPSPNDSLEEALDIHSGNITPQYNASVLFSGLLEWLCLENFETEYNGLQKYLEEKYPNIACQTWQMNVDEETILYTDNYALRSGASIVFSTEMSISEYKEYIIAADSNIDLEKFSFCKYCFQPIALIASRYYHQPVIPQLWRQYKKDDQYMTRNLNVNRKPTKSSTNRLNA